MKAWERVLGAAPSSNGQTRFTGFARASKRGLTGIRDSWAPVLPGRTFAIQEWSLLLCALHYCLVRNDIDETRSPRDGKFTAADHFEHG